MVELERDDDRDAYRLILRPNQSMTWRQLKWLFTGLCVFSFTIGSTMAALGYWPVLPFTGLEMLAVGSALYYVARRGHRCEVIHVDPDQVLIERGHRGPEQHWSLARIWARVVLERQPDKWYASRLLIRSQGRAIEVGSFLSEHERQQVARALRRDLGYAAS